MDNPWSRDKAVAAIRRRRGGKGSGVVSVPQKMLLAALGPGWVEEHTISTGPRRRGWATAYTVDLAFPLAQVAVEVDGAGHRGKAARRSDARRTAVLSARGWTVIRVTNAEVLRDVAAVAARVMLALRKST